MRMTITKSEDFKGALEHAVKANKPFLLDVHVDADVRPPATGTWELPPTPHKEPVFGKPLAADVDPRRAGEAERSGTMTTEANARGPWCATSPRCRGRSIPTTSAARCRSRW